MSADAVAPPPETAASVLDAVRRRRPTPRSPHHPPPRSRAPSQAEELLVSGAFDDASACACRVLAWAPREEAAGLAVAAAAVLLQAGRLQGAPPRALRDRLEKASGGQRAVPPEALVLWCGGGGHARGACLAAHP